MYSKKNIVLLILLIELLISIKAFAQPDRYWSVSFNSEASMLAGAVVGGNSDITSIYFNPAGISQIEDKKLMLNANLFKLDFENYSVSNSNDENNNDFSDWGFRVQPRFISYTYRSKVNPKFSFQFAVFNRAYEIKHVYVQETNPSQIYHSGVGETVLKNTDYRNDYADYWGGIGSSYQINSKLSVGISILGSIKSLTFDNSQFSLIQPDESMLPDSINSYTVSVDSYERIVMYDVRVLAKIGLQYTLEQWSFGINISVPSFRIMGNTDVKRKIDFIDYPEENGVSERYLINEYNQYRKSQFKDPLSIALGLVYTSNTGKSQYYFTTEYFKGIDTYLAVDGVNSIYPDDYPESTSFTSYKFGTKDIVNVAFGYKRVLSNGFDLILGGRTDFNAYEVSNEGEYKNINEISKVHNNLYHITIGSNFNYKRASFILGFENTFGWMNGQESYINTNNAILIDSKTTMDYSIYSIGLFLGFSLGF